MIFFLPIVFLFTFFEINKKKIASFIDDSKVYIMKNNDESKSKIIIDQNDDSKSITFLKNIDLNDFSNAEYRLFTILNDKIEMAEFSNSLVISKNNLIADKYTLYKNDLINISKKN